MSQPTLTVLSVIGTRPEGIKMAPVVNELAPPVDRLRALASVAGQHRQMLDQCCSSPSAQITT